MTRILEEKKQLLGRLLLCHDKVFWNIWTIFFSSLSHFISIALWFWTYNCTATVLQLYCNYTATALQLYCNSTSTVLPKWL